MLNKFFHYLGLICCVLLIVACFLPWTYYVHPNVTFTGFNVQTFPSGINYGRAGIPIAILSTIIFLLMFVPKVGAKRINLFIAGLLVAYAIRTFVVFTGSLIAGDVEKKIGIILVLILPVLILISTVFPKDGREIKS